MTARPPCQALSVINPFCGSGSFLHQVGQPGGFMIENVLAKLLLITASEAKAK